MQLFYISDLTGDTCQLSEEESWHCVKALRLKQGDPIQLTDGKGNFYQGRLIEIHPKGSVVKLLTSTQMPHIHSWRLHIAIAPTKNIERFEWFLEKATEIGIDEITPLICEHSERNTLKISRLEKVLVSAMKQSLKTWLPILNEPQNFKHFVSQEFKGQKFIAWCEAGIESELQKVYQQGSEVLILIGPEGDFSLLEVDLAKKAGFGPVSLGFSRFRTETAGIVACHTIDLLNKMK
ncbi:MAG: 16S rRNA (uracil(1498)-N(3))-methyltransferase [Bacteroidales bacterium]|jgi:16S rRNA (uracil1498-N3)-methyltransferase|nr:16S rRNA (uracil(1498)-N(3))-methyltransferase [Bacteroidales bacterium]